MVGLDFYRDVVKFCRQHGIYILSDLAYAEIYFEDEPPPSILQIPGAKEISVEFTSLSKTYSMPGWRIGFASGNDKLIAALARIKSYLDYGAFTPIQVAATAALNGPQDVIDEARATYQRRRDVLVESFARAGWDIPSPSATMFAWAPIPDAYRDLGSLEFSKLLLDKAKVAVSPGIQCDGLIATVIQEQDFEVAVRIQVKPGDEPGCAVTVVDALGGSGTEIVGEPYFGSQVPAVGLGK